jgi:hypothetical protein
MLDLGRGKESVGVSVNGRGSGKILWKPLIRADVTGAWKPAAGCFEIKSANLRLHRIVGGQQSSATERHTFTGFKPSTKGSPLLEWVLVGPVRPFTVTIQ